MIATTNDLITKIQQLNAELPVSTEDVKNMKIKCQRGDSGIRSIRDVMIQDGEVVIKMY